MTAGGTSGTSGTWDGSRNSVEGLAQRVLQDAQRTLERKDGSLYDAVMGFYHAVDWTEPWLRGLLAAHVVLFAATVLARRNPSAQLAIFVLVGALVGLSERLNGLCRDNWRAFATQNYFDRHGVFASVVWAAPLLFVAGFQVLYNVYAMSNLLVTVKRAELREKRRADDDDSKKKSKKSTKND